MGVVVSEIEVSVPPDVAFSVASEVENYPSFMPNIKSVKVLERNDDGYSKITWTASVNVASINKDIIWTEEEWWDKPSKTCKFALLEGDYTRYEGDWAFTQIPNGTRIRLRVDYDLGLPLIGPLINKLLDKIMLDNLNGMLSAIKQKAESKESKE